MRKPYYISAAFFVTFVYTNTRKFMDVVRLYQFIAQTRRSGSSGHESDTEFNSNLSIVDKEVYRTMVPFYAKDDRIQKLMAPFLSNADLPVMDGYVDLPADFNKYIDTMFGDGDKIVYPRNLNEKSRIRSSPIDNPDLDSEEYYCFFEGSRISYLPAEVEECSLVYLRVPVPGEIRFEYEEDEENDYITPVQVRPVEWPEELFGLFSALMLEKFGFQNRESVAIEYSNLGINRELANTTR